jgi:hypothetical protein
MKPEIKADPECERCHGSGIDPDSKVTYHDGAPCIGDPGSLEPCTCLLEQWAAIEPTALRKFSIMTDGAGG